MVGCYFHAHRPQDGQWLPADAMPKSDTGQPIAYVAKGAHGLYTSVSAWSVPACHLLPGPSFWSVSLTQSRGPVDHVLGCAARSGL